MSADRLHEPGNAGPQPDARELAWMLISKDQRRWKAIDAAKVSGGRFLTRASVWLTPHVEAFLRDAKPRVVVDPFAGAGDILAAVRERGFEEAVGYDIDPAGHWVVNDSLVSIPGGPGSVIATNPPYLARHSAKRKRVYDRVAHHFEASPRRNDLYQIALDRCLEAADHVVAIIPETFVNSRYEKERLASLTILEESPFHDTDCPVCVACFDARTKSLDDVRVFKDATEIGTLGAFDRLRVRPQRTHTIRFNVPDGRIALRAVDLPDPAKPIAFLRREHLDYAAERIKVSSRLVTFLEVPSLAEGDLDPVVSAANEILARFRHETRDVVLSPFKGNTKHGARRRRLDYATARAILEQALDATTGLPGSLRG